LVDLLANPPSGEILLPGYDLGDYTARIAKNRRPFWLYKRREEWVEEAILRLLFHPTPRRQLTAFDYTMRYGIIYVKMLSYFVKSVGSSLRGSVANVEI
jgi:hypothetical protein